MRGKGLGARGAGPRGRHSRGGASHPSLLSEPHLMVEAGLGLNPHYSALPWTCIRLPAGRTGTWAPGTDAVELLLWTVHRELAGGSAAHHRAAPEST